MDLSYFKLLLSYNSWANARILEALSVLSTEELTKNLSTSHNSILETFVHIMFAESIWRMRCQGESKIEQLNLLDFNSFELLKKKLSAHEHQQQYFIDMLGDPDIGRIVTYLNLKGENWEYPLYQIIQHLVNHSTYHRGQIITMLRQLGHEAVTTDFLVYIDLR